MLTLVALFAADKSVSFLGYLGFREAKRRATIRKATMNWDQNGQKTVFVDRKLEKLAIGTPNIIEKKIANFVIAFVRNLVQREAFEHLVRGLCCSSSGMRRKLEARQGFKKAAQQRKRG